MAEAVPQDWERARAVMEIWNADGPAAMAERFWHPDIVWTEPEHFPDAGVHRGRDECVRRMRERFDLLGRVTMEVVGVSRFGERTVIEAIMRGSGLVSGAPAEAREWFVVETDGQAAITFREFLDRDEAEAAAQAD